MEGTVTLTGVGVIVASCRLGDSLLLDVVDCDPQLALVFFDLEGIFMSANF